jgi:transposase
MLRQMERSTIQFLVKRGKSQRQIARELKLSRTTVARALREPVDKKPGRRQRASKVDPFRPQIEQWLHEGISTVRMFELARSDSEQPYTGGRSVFSDHVRRMRLAQERARADVAIRFAGLPGEYLQVDWGEVRAFPFAQQAPATRYFLACRLKYSRWSWVCWTRDMRQETLVRGLVACLCALGWVPWVLVFDNMKTVTSGRDAAGEPIWTAAMQQLAGEFGFHLQACDIAAANQKGSVESLVKWVKGNFLAGRSFADDTDLAQQTAEWTATGNTRRPSAATDETPAARLAVEAVQGGALPPTAPDYGVLASGEVTAESLVHVAGNVYSIPVGHSGAPITVRLHRTRVRLWRDTVCLADHPRAPDGAHQRVIEPAHFAPLFARKRRAQVMLYREALLALGAPANSFISEVSRRQRHRLRAEILAVYALLEEHGPAALLAAMTLAEQAGVYGADYLGALLAPPTAAGNDPLARLGVPGQTEVDRLLSAYEAYVEGEVASPEQTEGSVPAVAS